jgi:hypothetical protein
MLKIIYGAVVFFVVPAILLTLFIISSALPSQAENAESRISGRAGFFAGLILFTGYVVSTANGVQTPHFPLDQLPSTHWLGVLTGLGAGYLFPFVLRIAQPSRVLGVLTLLLSAMSLIALFSYVFDSQYRNLVMYFALSSIFGALINMVFSPQVIKEVLGHGNADSATATSAHRPGRQAPARSTALD